MPRVLEKINDRTGGYKKLYFDGKNVVYKERTLFDRDTDDWDSYYCSFSPDAFRKGINELIQKGKCKIKEDDYYMSLSLRDRGISGFVEDRTGGTNVFFNYKPEELLEVLP